MMVTVALTLFIMTILSTAFSTALETFRQLKAIGDMQDQLRTATNMLRADLSADHFEGKRRLSDTNFWAVGPPREGFLRITQDTDTTNDANEGQDADNIWSRRRVKHSLHMTIKRRGNRPSDFFSAPLPSLAVDPQCPLLTAPLPSADGRFQDPGSNVFNSQWAEVVWFLYPVQAANPKANGTQLYGLYRQQRLVIPDPSTLNSGTSRKVYRGPLPLTANQYYMYPYSCFLQPAGGIPPGQYVYFNSPSGLTIPDRRMQQPYTPRMDYSTGTTFTGEDLVMTNVISFDIQVLSLQAGVLNQTTTSPGMVDLKAPMIGTTTASVPFFDTWSSIQDELGNTTYTYPDPTTVPKYVIPNTNPVATTNITISGIQITLRVWDARTQQTRQITIFQEM
jgi:hypothetical protein